MTALLAACAAPQTSPLASPSAEPTASGQLSPSVGSIPSVPSSSSEPPSATLGPPLTPLPSEGSPSPPPQTGFDPSTMRIVLEPLVTGLAQPVALAHATDGSGNLFIVEREGRILVLDPQGQLQQQPMLDIRDRVDTQGERGLHYLVFHPAYESNGRFFVHWTDASNMSYIQEYRGTAGETVAPDSGRTVLRIQHPDWNHKGGWMGFGEDGYLYIAVGDGGGNTPGDPFGNGQDRSDLLGNILRIDVDGERPYAVPQDNPYFGQRGGNTADEIWAYGLRNPWRASFDRETGNLWIGDVGQDATEEIDVIPAGQGGLNFGWSDMEGTRCHNLPDCDPADYTGPIATYRTDADCAVTGGHVYRGSASPLLAGAYLFGDYCSGTIWGFDAAAALETGQTDFGRLAATNLNIVSIDEDESGELYAVDIGGTVQRITAQPRP